MSEEAQERLTDEDRRKFLAKMRSALFWVGRRIPDREIIDGEKVDLKEVVFRYIANDSPTEEKVKGAISLAMELQCKVDEMEHRLRNDDMTRVEALDLLDRILGLMRAIDELKKRGGRASEVKLQALVCKVDDERRWLDFVRSIK
jgi:hypothetical protein